MKRILLLVTVLSIVGAQMVAATPPRTMSYQGVLTSDTGVIVPDGSYNITFRIYDDPSTGSMLWEETQSVSVTTGRFDVILGSSISLGTLAFDIPYWLAIEVSGDSEMSTRIELASAPYSFMAKKVENSPGVASKTEGSINISDAFTTLASQSITVPEDGYVLVIGTTAAHVDHETGGVGAGSILEFGVTTSPVVIPPGREITYRIPPTVLTETFITPITVQRIIDVTAGTHTFYFIARVLFGTAGSPSADGNQLSLAYFPVAYGTVETTASGE